MIIENVPVEFTFFFSGKKTVSVEFTYYKSNPKIDYPYKSVEWHTVRVPRRLFLILNNKL